MKEIFENLKNRIIQEKGENKSIFYTDIINFVTRTPDKYDKYPEIIRFCICAMKKGEYII
jgi:hypothetical protein